MAGFRKETFVAPAACAARRAAALLFLLARWLSQAVAQDRLPEIAGTALLPRDLAELRLMLAARLTALDGAKGNGPG